jgi:nucleotide-binding universal stress UspA family protein
MSRSILFGSSLGGRESSLLPPFRRVVYATDLTPTSAGCATVAYALAADRGTVDAVHVLGPRAASEGRAFPHLRADLERQAPADATARRVETVVHVLQASEVAAAIVRLVERVGAEAVVLGTRARGPVGRWLWGSVASEVAPAVRALTLFVGSSTRIDAARPRPRSVLLPLEISLFEGEAVHVAYRLVSEGGVVHLLHAWEFAYAESARDDLSSPYHPRGEEREVHERELHERLSKVIPAWASSRGVRTETHVVEDGDPIDAIRNVADRLDVDMLVLPTHGRRGFERAWFGSVAAKVLRSGRAAVVVRLPEAASQPERSNSAVTGLGAPDA